MRKQNSWITVVLVFLVALSFLFSYFILYNMVTFERLISDEARVSEEERVTDPIQATANYYSPTRLSFQDVVSSDQYIIRLGQQSYFIRDKATINTLRSLIESRPITVEDVTLIDDPMMLNNLLDIDHLQLQLPTRMPLGVYSRVLSVQDDVPTDVLIDRIIIPLASQEEQTVYLIDSTTERYIEAQLSSNLRKEELRNAVTLDRSDLIEVIRYDGANKPIYLPVNTVTLESELFTLDVLPENIYVSDLFDNSGFNTTEVSSRNDEEIFRYQNYINTLDVNRTTQQFDLTISRADPSDPRTTVEKYRNAFTMVQKFEYWDGDIRLFSEDNNYITFRRYLNNMPILTNSSMTDYGANIVQMRGDLSGDVYRYHQPMLTFYTHVDTASQEYELMSHNELLIEFQERGYTVNGFDDIFIGYEWQEDMEMFRKAELIPTWFFKLDGEYYTLEEVQSDSFVEIWNNEMLNEGGND